MASTTTTTTTTSSTKTESPPSVLSTSTANTHVRCLPPPPTNHLTIADLFDASTGGGKPRLDLLREHLLAEGRLEEDAALMIIERGESLLRSENTLIELEAPITGKNASNKSIFPF
jgi:serine/threonine-protein phosphatase 2B catalytic subunit